MGIGITTLVVCLVLQLMVPQNAEVHGPAFVLDALHWNVASLVAAWLAWLGYRDAPPGMRPAHLWFFIGLVLYEIGQLLWVALEFAGLSNYPNITDAFFLVLAPCVAIGVVKTMPPSVSRAVRRSIVLDAAGLAITALAVSLALYLPLKSNTNLFGLAVIAAYPIAYLTAGWMCLLTVQAVRPRLHDSWLAMIASLLMTGLLWLLWNLSALETDHEFGVWYNASYSVLSLALGWAAWRWHLAPAGGPPQKDRIDLMVRLLPMLVVLGVSIAVIVINVAPGVLPSVRLIVNVCAAAVFTLALLRQSLLLHEHHLLLEAQHEAHLRERQVREKFASAFQSSADFMMILRQRDMVIVEVNEAAACLTGWSLDALMGGRYLSFNFQRDPVVRGEIEAALRARRPIKDIAMVLHRKDGTTRDCLATVSRFTDGGRRYLTLIIRDVTAARAAEREIHALNRSLDASVRQLQAITDNLPVMISYVDTDRRIRFVNKTGATWLARPPVAIVGEQIDALLDDTFADVIRDLSATLSGGANSRGEWTKCFPDGVTRTCDLHRIVDRDDEGRVRGVYSLLTDITERRATEEQLRHAQRLDALGKLTGGVAHDFNNLLAVMTGSLELIETKLGDRPDLRGLLHRAINATERGATLTRSLLAFARQQPLAPSQLDLNHLIRDMAVLVQGVLPENVSLDLDLADPLWPCHVDSGQLQNALLNLVVNARDAMPSGGAITIRTAHAERPGEGGGAARPFVVLSVSDTGAGMTADVAARAFEPFFTTKSGGLGSGLGLSMVYGFASQSGGLAEIDSAPGEGTTVRLYLPRGNRDGDAPEVTMPEEAPAAAGESLLVVEDDPDVLLLVSTMARALGYAVTEATDAAQALAVLDGGLDVDLLLTDVVLKGGKNGRQLAEEAQASHPGLKVLYMSGYTENAIIENGRIADGVHLLQKPFRKRDLAARIRETLAGPASA
ncbi:PAS domain S-box protein [Parapedomonas caeni]